jgi:hypothetical protein
MTVYIKGVYTMICEIYPKVYRADAIQRVNIKLSEDITDGDTVSVKIQPMESYSIAHTSRYCLLEEERYPYVAATRAEDGSFFLEHEFTGEQRYSVRVKICCAGGDSTGYDGVNKDGTIGKQQYVYSVADDLCALRPMKADTHLHTCRSDGEGTPFEVGIQYRKVGYDFIVITDHHKMAPSLEAREQFSALTDKFFVVRGEEVHNMVAGLFHIINIGGEISVNEIIEAGDGVAEAAIEKHLDAESYPKGTTPYICAFHRFVTDMIRQGGGVAVMAHPYWNVCGEYNMVTEDVKYLLRTNCYDALELLAGCDRVGYGNNLQVALWQELIGEGVRVPVVGCSDSHSRTDPRSLYNKQFSIVFAKDESDVLAAIKESRCVAVNKRENYTVYGSFRLVKYARFLIDEYYPDYEKLTMAHAEALADGDKNVIAKAESDIDKFVARFFAFDLK